MLVGGSGQWYQPSSGDGVTAIKAGKGVYIRTYDI